MRRFKEKRTYQKKHLLPLRERPSMGNIPRIPPYPSRLPKAHDHTGERSPQRVRIRGWAREQKAGRGQTKTWAYRLRKKIRDFNESGVCRSTARSDGNAKGPNGQQHDSNHESRQHRGGDLPFRRARMTTRLIPRTPRARQFSFRYTSTPRRKERDGSRII